MAGLFDDIAAEDDERYVSPELQRERDRERLRIVRAEYADPRYDASTRSALARELERIQPGASRFVTQPRAEGGLFGDIASEGEPGLFDDIAAEAPAPAHAPAPTPQPGLFDRLRSLFVNPVRATPDQGNAMGTGQAEIVAAAAPPAPTLAERLQQPQPDYNPQTDAEWLSKAPETQQRILAQATRKAPPVLRAMPKSEEIVSDVARASANPVYRGLASGFGQLAKSGIGAARLAADLVGADDTAAFLGASARLAGTMQGEATRGLTGNEKLIADVVASIEGSTPAIMAGMLGGPAYQLMFAQSALGEYNDGRDAGFGVSESAARAGIMGLAEVAGERFDFGPQIEVLRKLAAGKSAHELSALAAETITKNLAGEQVTTLTQFLADKIGPAALNPNATLADLLEQAGETFKVSLAQSGVMAGGPAAIAGVRDVGRRAEARDTLDGDYEALARSKGFLASSSAPPVPGASPPIAPMPAPRAEYMPPRPFTPEEVQTLKAAAAPAVPPVAPAVAEPILEPRLRAPAAPPAGVPAPDAPLPAAPAPAAPAGQVPPQLGVAAVPQGQLAAQAEELLRQQAVEDATGAAAAPAPAPAAAAAPAVSSADGQPGPQRAAAGGADRAGAAKGAVPATAPAAVRDLRDSGRDAGGRGVDDASATLSLGAEFAAARQRLTQTAARAEQRGDTVQAARLRTQAAELPDMRPAPPGPERDGFSALADSWQQLTGVRPTAFVDARQDGYAADGFAYGKRIFVNVSGVQQHVALTAAHEFRHYAARKAEQGDARMRRAEKALDAVFDLISPEGKRQYAEKYLYRQPLKAGAMTIEEALASPELREEMTADFMGQRFRDRTWLRQLAAKEPSLFGDFVQSWLRMLDDLIASLRGKGRLGAKNIDRYIAELEQAKALAQEVATEWAEAGRAGAPAAAPATANEDVQLSRRQADRDRLGLADELDPGDISDLGSFNLDRMMSDKADEDYSLPDDIATETDDGKKEEPFEEGDLDFGPIDEEESGRQDNAAVNYDDIAEELAAEGIAVVRPPRRAPGAAPGAFADFSAVPDSAIKAAGLMAEDAFPDLPYRDNEYGGQTAIVRINGRDYQATARFDKPDLPTYDRGAVLRANVPDETLRRGSAMSPGLMHTAVQVGWNKRALASVELFRRGFDLADAVPKGAVARVAKLWKRIAGMPGAFEYQRPSATAKELAGKGNVEIVQTLATQMFAGTKVSVTARRAEVQYGPRSVELLINDGKGKAQKATIELDWRSKADGGPTLVMHTEDLARGSGAGKVFYQVAFNFADMIDLPVEADASGLVGANTYRRTEQMMSAAARSGKTSNVKPGFGQRVYGFNRKARGDAQSDKNLARIALAAARNAVEMVPEVQGWRYDVKGDRFVNAAGRDVTGHVSAALARAEVREMSVSRSTLARAALTLEAIKGEVDLDGLQGLSRPVLYSRRQRAEDAPLAERLTGRQVSVPVRVEDTGQTASLRVEDTGQTASLRVDAGSHLARLEQRRENLKRLAACLG